MRLSELTIIYFATAAPFGVASFLRQPSRGARRTGALARAAGAALLWPLAALLLVLGRGAASGGGRDEEAGAHDGALDESRAERAKRALTNALRAAEDVWDEENENEPGGEGRGAKGEEGRYAMFAARESVERYVGLTLACAGARSEASASARELELCRLAGSAGDDLLLAGRCIHRRNVTRLFAHRERARAEMIHALAALRDVSVETHAPKTAWTSAQTNTQTYATGALTHTNNQPCAPAARRASEALLRAFARAVELFSVLEDEEAARRAARLLDAECARLRRLEAAAEILQEDGGRKGAQPCTTRAAHRAFATPLLRTTTSRRG